MRTRLSILSFVVVSATVALVAQTPTPAPQPTFRSGVNYVRVDMYATTREGLPITDLRQDEVEILEDDAPQTIERFEHVQVRGGTPQELRVEPNTVAESRQMAADPRARVFVIFLDTYHTQIEGSANMRTPLVRFIDRLMGPDDLVAVMTPEMAASDVTFGRKTTVISNIMEREWTWGRRGQPGQLDDREVLYEACYANEPAVAREMKDRRREKLTLDALDDLAVHLQGIREERKAVIAVSEGWMLYGPSRTLLDSSRDRLSVPAVPAPGRPRQERPRTTNVDLTQCEADRFALAQVDDRNRLREVAETANRGNVTFYPVYPRGLAVFDSPIGPDAPPPLDQDLAGLRTRQDALRVLATETDGTPVIDTNDIEGALTRIVADLSSYYLMGYYSTNTKLDGKFRTISVRVKRPGARVRARRGYRGLTPAEVLTRADGPTTAAPALPAVSINSRASLRLRAASWTSTPDGTPAATVWLTGELDAATRRDLVWATGARAEIAVVSATGEAVATAAVDVGAGEGAFAVKLPAQGTLQPGEYAIRVRMIPPDPQALPITDVTRAVVASLQAPFGDAVLWRRGASTGPRFVVTADPRYRRSDRIRLELPVLETTSATARMLERNGQAMQVPVTVSERTDTATGARWIVAEAVLAPLAPGDYAIEVTAGGAKQVTPFRIVP